MANKIKRYESGMQHLFVHIPLLLVMIATGLAVNGQSAIQPRGIWTGSAISG